MELERNKYKLWALHPVKTERGKKQSIAFNVGFTKIP